MNKTLSNPAADLLNTLCSCLLYAPGALLFSRNLGFYGLCTFKWPGLYDTAAPFVLVVVAFTAAVLVVASIVTTVIGFVPPTLPHATGTRLGIRNFIKFSIFGPAVLQK